MAVVVPKPLLEVLLLMEMSNVALTLRSRKILLATLSSLREPSLFYVETFQEICGTSLRTLKTNTVSLSAQLFSLDVRILTLESACTLALTILTLLLLLSWTRLSSNITAMLRELDMFLTWITPSFSAHLSLLKMPP